MGRSIDSDIQISAERQRDMETTAHIHLQQITGTSMESVGMQLCYTYLLVQVISDETSSTP